MHESLFFFLNYFASVTEEMGSVLQRFVRSVKYFERFVYSITIASMKGRNGRDQLIKIETL